jgi:hypothetical protein
MEILKNILGFGALVLGIVNGIALLLHYLKDKPKLKVQTIYPVIYQWWFRLPGGLYQGKPTRKYGFLVYIDVINQGLRKVTLSSWQLVIENSLGKRIELTAKNIPEPKIAVSDLEKRYPVLGQSTTSNLNIDSGCSTSGMAYYCMEIYGKGWDPKIGDGKIFGQLEIKDVFNNKSQTKIVLSEKPLTEIEALIEGIVALESNSLYRC